MLSFGSLFAGIGGVDLGFERAGMNCKWQVEIDDYATRILEKHWPNVRRYRDIRDVRKLEYVDVIAGGFPCQDISNAGGRKGITGERSGLWKEYLRVICMVRPRYIIVENVAALTHRGIDTVLGDLYKSGYDAEWDCIPAAAVGAPHRRDRVFIMAYPNSNGPLGESQSKKGCNRHKKHIIKSESQDVAHTIINGCPEMSKRFPNTICPGRTQNILQKVQNQKVSNSHVPRLAHRIPESGEEMSLERYRFSKGKKQWETEPGVGRVAHGIPDRVDRIKCLGNAVVPQVAEFIGQRIIEIEKLRA